LQGSLTQLNEAQQRLIETEKMASLGNLVAGVAHEVNTPLGICITVVSLNLEKLRELKQQAEDGTMTRKSLQQYFAVAEESQMLAEANLHRASQLVQNFKKVAVDQNSDTFEDLVFHDYLQEMIDTLATALEDTDISIKLHSEGNWKIRTCRAAWWQILSNLVENSVAHGFRETARGKITINAQMDHGHLRFIYSDNGRGMSQTELEKIYEPFYTTARHQGSTGLGMQVVFNLVVQKFGGDISCQSEPGQGVVFIIDIQL
jgi:signal transduction histidine kinase